MKDDAYLLVIDVQKKLTAAMDEAVCSAVIKNTGILIDTAQLYNLPVLVTEQYPKGLGSTVDELAAKLDGVTRFDKLCFDATREPAVVYALQSSPRRTVIITGMESHICVMSTALSLKAKAYTVYVAYDAVCSRNSEHSRVALDAMRAEGIKVVPTESLVYAIAERAGTDEFKKVLSFIK